ncbi:MAG: hypothetical protein P9L96_06915 [Candidatus Gygaella obscura]|nr:hypothetical protein [Candidatus Gygaella obscura]
MARKNRKFHRGLEDEYLRQLMTRGSLSFLRNSKLIGKNIDIQIRNNYINLYYKGASLIRFEWKNRSNYEIKISEAYFEPVSPKGMGVCPSPSKDKEGKDRLRVFKYDIVSIRQLRQNFKDIVSQFKKNIDYLGRGKENVFEQLFIESNLNQKNEPGFIILDRQIVVEGLKRLDLVALSKLENSIEYRMNLIELKYGEDSRIAEVHDKQLDMYYRLFLNDYTYIALEYEKIIVQKKAINRWPYRSIDFRISKNSNTMRKIAIFGNIKENSCLLIKAKKQFDRKTFYVVTNNILKEEELL